MSVRGAAHILIAAGFFLTAGTAAQKDVSPEAVRQRMLEKYQGEKNPKGRIKIATELTEADVKEVLAAYKTDMPGERGAKAVSNYVAALELLRTAVIEAQHAGSSKNAEIRLRGQIRSLEQLMYNLSSAERTLFEPVLESVRQTHREALNVVIKK